MRSAGHRSWQIRQPAAQSKLRELRQRARSACFVPVVAINKPDFLAGYLLFYVSARYRAVFLAAIENNQNFSLRPVCYMTDKSKFNKKKPDISVELSGGDSRSRTDDPLLAKQML